MAHPVKLYVYDLSNGLARQMSLQLTGRQIDGIWHTSIVVYGKEIFYGQGINITAPGRSHHGSPLNIVDLGTTDIDEDTFNEYLEELKEQYTADKYHLLDFNCNSFTNDVAGFLTGGSIPDYIKDLPTDFLSTPFGAALRPTIDAMYRRPTPGTTPAQVPTPTPTAAPAMPNPELVGSILQAVAAQAQQGSLPSSAPSASNQSTDSLTSPLHPCNNSASFQSLIRSHKAVVACFSNVVTCPPCRVIAPVFEDLARQKGVKTGGGGGAAFTKIDLTTPSGQSLGSEWGVRVMPTFMFFLDGKKISEMKGADANELRTQIDLLLFQAYPPHKHTSLSLPAMQALSLKPILFTQVPALDAVANKLVSFVDSANWSAETTTSAEQVKRIISTSVLPYLKSRFMPPEALKNKLPSANPTLLSAWNQATVTLAKLLPPESLFPLVDMWRLALLDPAVGTWCAANPLASPITTLLNVPSTKTTVQQCPRPYMLTLLRLLSNAFSSSVLSPRLLIDSLRSDMTAVLVPSLLHSDAGVRTAAASLAFNCSAFLQSLRVEAVKSGGGATGAGDIENEDWEVETVSAVIEAIDREKESEDVVHRLTASLGCLLRLSPFYETQLNPLLDVLQARQVLQSKLAAGGCGEKGVQKTEVKKLVEEMTNTDEELEQLTTIANKLTLSTRRKRTFPFNDLPVELQRKIVLPIAQQSQSTFWSLNLTCQRTRALIPIEEILEYLPVILAHTYQLQSFFELVSSKPDLASLVRHLWLINDASRDISREFGNYIIRICPNIVSLACKRDHVPPASVRNLTILEGSRVWTSHIARLADSLKSLHLITGTGGHRKPEIGLHSRIQCVHTMMPSLRALERVAISIGRDVEQHFDEGHLESLVEKSPHLQKVVLFVHRKRVDDAALESLTTTVAPILESKVDWSVRRCPRRLTERKLWEDSVLDDGGMIWRS
ncbi:hypothetical protein VNI00_002685 [Paramarasmius palmivorus]|uniref:DUF862-domain-containing protein n=1 Tax=Paramarasmius palmivorus TaxID=297713 RepID=A0AAW0DYY2_9AGAR